MAFKRYCVKSVPHAGTPDSVIPSPTRKIEQVAKLLESSQRADACALFFLVFLLCIVLGRDTHYSTLKRLITAMLLPL